MKVLVYVNIEQGNYKVKLKIAQNEKRKKLRGFSLSINMANFEAFRQVISSSIRLLFLKSVIWYYYCISIFMKSSTTLYVGNSSNHDM